MNTTRATARPYVSGIKDTTIGAIPVQPELIPQNCPMYGVMTARGPSTAQYSFGQPMIKMFGADSFVETKKFYSHQTAYLNKTSSLGNLVGIKRLLPSDAAAGVFAFGVEIVAADLTVWQTDSENKYVLDINGDKIDTGTTRAGVLKRLVKMDADESNYNQLVPVNGTLTDAGGTPSMIYPIIAMRAEYGSFSSNTGFRLEVADSTSGQPSDIFAQEDQEAMLYRWTWLERSKLGATPDVTNSLKQSEQVDFSFKHGMFNTKTNKNYDRRRILSEYESRVAGFTPVSGPVEDLVIYDAYIATALEILYTAESSVVDTMVTEKELINLIGETDKEGRAYKAIQDAPISANTMIADGINTFYLSGGADGTVNEEQLDLSMRAWLRGDWDDPDEPLNSWAIHPFSTFQDSGFEIETKKAMVETIGRRDDITVDLATFIASQPANDIAAELAVGQTIVNHGLLIPESLLYGTQSCRFNVWGSEGVQVDSLFGRRCSLLYDVIAKFARFGGAANGFLNGAESYDDRENNAVTEVKDVTHSYKPEDLENQYWDIGINYPVNRTRAELFWAAYQTAYEEDSSVLNTVMYVKIMANLKRMSRRHWALNSGTNGLTETQFADRSDQDWIDLTTGRYAGKMVITGETRFTPDDSEAGFSWSVYINASADPSRTVGQYFMSTSRL